MKRIDIYVEDVLREVLIYDIYALPYIPVMSIISDIYLGSSLRGFTNVQQANMLCLMFCFNLERRNHVC